MSIVTIPNVFSASTLIKSADVNSNFSTIAIAINTTLANGGAAVYEQAGGTNQTSYTTGDMLYASATNTLSKLAVGATGQYLRVLNGIPSWQSFTTSLNVVTKTADYTATLNDDQILVNANSGNVIITLPAVATATGKLINITKVDSSTNTVTVKGNGAELINGANTQVLSAQYESLYTVCSGTIWGASRLIGGPQERHEVAVYGANSFGGSSSGDTQIRNFSTVLTNVGTSITYTARTATTGDKFTINADGMYAISYVDNASASGRWIGISVNGTTTTAVYSLTPATAGGSGQIAVASTPAADAAAMCSVTLKLTAADVIRAHTDAFTFGATTNACYFRITKVST